MLSDEDLVKKITSGKSDLFRELVERYEARLLRYAASIAGGDQTAAQDIVQEAFIKTYVKLNSFNTKRKFSSWMYRIVHNEAINYCKKHKKELHPDDEACRPCAGTCLRRHSRRPHHCHRHCHFQWHDC